VPDDVSETLGRFCNFLQGRSDIAEGVLVNREADETPSNCLRQSRGQAKEAHDRGAVAESGGIWGDVLDQFLGHEVR
jgi:hypothetical protein